MLLCRQRAPRQTKNGYKPDDTCMLRVHALECFLLGTHMRPRKGAAAQGIGQWGYRPQLHASHRREPRWLGFIHCQQLPFMSSWWWGHVPGKPGIGERAASTLQLLAGHCVCCTCACRAKASVVLLPAAPRRLLCFCLPRQGVCCAPARRAKACAVLLPAAPRRVSYFCLPRQGVCCASACRAKAAISLGSESRSGTPRHSSCSLGIACVVLVPAAPRLRPVLGWKVT